jgi:hypothetical protein
MVRQDRLTEQVDPKVLRLMSQLLIDPNLAMVIVLPADHIFAKQKAPPHRAIHDVDNRNFIRRKNLHTSQPRHSSPVNNMQFQHFTEWKSNNRRAFCLQSAVSPVFLPGISTGISRYFSDQKKETYLSDGSGLSDQSRLQSELGGTMNL